MGEVMNSEFAQKELVLQKEIAPTIVEVDAIKVLDVATYECAGNACKTLTTLEKRIKDYWEEDIARAYSMHKSLVSKREEMMKPVSARKALLRDQMKAWEDEQERVRREEQARADAEAKRLAEEQALAEAAMHEAAGDHEAAAAVIEQPLAPAPVVVASTVPKGFGTFTRRTWRAEVTDLMALVKAVAAGKAPIKCLEANMPFLNNQARALNTAMNIPGVKAVQ